MPRPLSFTAAASLLSLAIAVTADNDYILAGDAGISAQQLFLGTEKTVYIVDKTENNPMQVNGHPAWAAQWSLDSQTTRGMDIVTNSFCAGGVALGNGTWLNVGGNQPVGKLGATVVAGAQPYTDTDGGKAVRLLDPCDDASCEWADNPAMAMTTRRWYPSLETLEDGQAMILGGEQWGGFVCQPDQHQNNPTYEIFPSKREPVALKFLNDSMPLNLYPLTWLLPSGNIFLQANYMTEIFDYKKGVEHALPDIPHAARTYPASAATAMLPLTPANNYTATVLFCGGTALKSDEWARNVTWYQQRVNSASCVHMTPDTNAKWVENDDQPQGRSMGQFIILPDQRLFLTNGIETGVAGYDSSFDLTGVPYGDNPVYSGAYFNSSAPKGQRWSTKGVGNLTYPRMYHSSATLLPDGSVFISGSNPYPDFVTKNTPGKKWWSETRNEIFRPDYFSKPRPNVTGMPTSLSYGGQYFNLTLSASSISNVASANDVKVVAIKTGFSTHAMNMGQRLVELSTSMTGNSDGSATLHVSQLPPNPAIFQPGPSLVFVVVNGVPSQGKMLMAGSGKIETQTLGKVQALPNSSGVKATSLSSSGSVGSGSGGNSTGPGANGKTGDAAERGMRHRRGTTVVLVIALVSVLCHSL